MDAVGSNFIENLESRMFLSADVDFDHGVLRVHGVENASNTIVVGNSSDGLKVNVSINSTQTNGITRTLTASVPRSLGIMKVRIAGGHLADTISIDQTSSPFTIKTTIDGRGGKDSISGGDEDDVIIGGAGQDLLSGGSGNDLIFGRAGDDTLIGGEGNDTLWGGEGHDSIDGGNGDDVLGVILGAPNTLMGGAGHDTFWVRSIQKNPTNDYNPAEDFLKMPKSKPTAKSADLG